VVPQKRKRGGSLKKSGADQTLHIFIPLPDHLLPVEKPPPREIEYKIAIYTPQQMKKTRSSRGPPITHIVNLYSNKSWRRLKTHILTKISAVLKPANINFFDYTITFTVPRQVCDPMHIADIEHYEYLVKKALLGKNPVARIVVEPKEV
jgi:hypothetical protein